MTKFLFAVALAAVVAPFGTADEKPVTAPPVTTAPVTSGPVIVGTPGTPVVEYGPTVQSAPARRGLFGRLRNRGSSTPISGYSTPLPSGTIAPGTIVAPAPIPMPTPGTTVPQPMPMPGVKPISGTVITTPGTVVVAGGPTPTTGTVIVAGNTMPAEMMMMPTMSTSTMTMSSTPARRGLFGRLRNR